MITATIFEAKTNLSELIKQALNGETVLITFGREKKPMVTLSPVEPLAKRRLGFMEHLGIEIPDSFFDPLPEEELRLWNGEGE
jgi:antitoxin (DNA-binding transcriptional repressor) of toxin-antitoxin stability system